MLGPFFRTTRRSRTGYRGLATNLSERLFRPRLEIEAKRHSLSPSGNKATLITRIQHAEKRADSSTSINPDDHIRRLATAPAQPTQSSRPHHPTLDVKLPDLSGPQEVAGPHIPFLPDIDSSRVRTADAIHHSPTCEAPIRKVLVVAGAGTHHAGGPSYGPSHHSEMDEDHCVHEPVAPRTGVWGDVVEDLGLSPSFHPSASFTMARDTVSSIAKSTWEQTQATRQQPSSSRPLDADEARGVWVLLGILGGSWLAGGLFDTTRKKDHLHKT